MSYDFDSTLRACDHMIAFERYVVDSNDFKTLHYAGNLTQNFRAPINGRNKVKVYIRSQLISQNDPTYGYDIVVDKNQLETPDIFYKIVFRQPVRWFVPLIEITYLTLQPYCLKCNGYGKLNDVKSANSGSLIHIVGTSKMVQRCLKFTLTSRCVFYPKFTCPIKDYIGKKFGISITETDIANQFLQALDNLKIVQAAQQTIQSLDSQEILKEVTNVSAEVDPDDPTAVSISAQVASYGSTTTQPVAFRLVVAP